MVHDGYVQGDAAFCATGSYTFKPPVPKLILPTGWTKKIKLHKSEMTSSSFPDENGITRTKLPSLPVINILHVPLWFTENSDLQSNVTLSIASHN